ncbi:hypothetical protein AFK69_08655 [Xenorhabdus sp. GDc328]|nr:hypothetical protein AAY47_03295 [Xenorhabdus griffiniae]KOP33702.1 hypothetical protein AFK69_08655 [Xenorhabdus sp. GDc328]
MFYGSDEAPKHTITNAVARYFTSAVVILFPEKVRGIHEKQQIECVTFSSNKRFFIQEVIYIPLLQSIANFICLFVNRSLFIVQQRANNALTINTT